MSLDGRNETVGALLIERAQRNSAHPRLERDRANGPDAAVCYCADDVIGYLLAAHEERLTVDE